MKKTIVFALLLSVAFSAACTVKIKDRLPDAESSLDFDIQNAAVMEITVLGKPGFVQITDEAVIEQVTEGINNTGFALQKTQSSQNDAYEIKWYNKKAECIETMIVVSDTGILYGKNSDNYETGSGGSIDYDFIKQLFSKE